MILQKDIWTQKRIRKKRRKKHSVMKNFMAETIFLMNNVRNVQLFALS